jgi:PD-(D/E)XK endonuclease
VNDLTPSQKGAAAEAAITAMTIQLGLTVLRPLCEGRRYDLVIDLEPALLRVQCKLARRVSGVLAVKLQTSRCTPGGYIRTSYTAAEVDTIAAYSPELHRGFPDPDQRGIGTSLDLSQARPDQEQPGQRDQMGRRLRVRIRNRSTAIWGWAGDVPSPGGYTFRVDRGAIAQLGERLAGSQKVVGSSPTSSIILI